MAKQIIIKNTHCRKRPISVAGVILMYGQSASVNESAIKQDMLDRGNIQVVKEKEAGSVNDVKDAEEKAKRESDIADIIQSLKEKPNQFDKEEILTSGIGIFKKESSVSAAGIARVFGLEVSQDEADAIWKAVNAQS
jgi:hypothetical protein